MTRPPIPAAILAVALLASCAGAKPDPDAGESASALPLSPFAVHEACVKLAPGDRLDWRFESKMPVDFNIHYHDGPSVVMPVTRAASFGDAGIYVAAIPHDYCAMWEAGPIPTLIDFRVRPIRSGR